MDTQETRIFIAVIITGVLLGTIVAYFFISIIRHQRRLLHLQRENILAELRVMERERTRIATDLHDDLGPLLSVVKFQIDSVETVSPAEKDRLLDASGSIDDLIQKLRDIANNLMPSALLRKGLAEAIEELKYRIEGAHDLRIDLICENSWELPREKSINIFRIVQEVVHNCLKHAQATVLSIHMEARDGQLHLLCRDNGRGFDYRARQKDAPGFGLASLKNRSRIMGGTMEVESKPGVGSAFLFVIPL